MVKETLHFEIVDISVEPTENTSQIGLILAFVPTIGFISCAYYNGSKTWVSNETKKTVEPTHYLKKIEDWCEQLEELKAEIRDNLPCDCVEGYGEVKYCPNRLGDGNKCKHCDNL